MVSIQPTTLVTTRSQQPNSRNNMSSNVTQLDLSTFSASAPSICIPRVFPNITKARVEAIFRNLGFVSWSRWIWSRRPTPRVRSTSACLSTSSSGMTMSRPARLGRCSSTTSRSRSSMMTPGSGSLVLPRVCARGSSSAPSSSGSLRRLH